MTTLSFEIEESEVSKIKAVLKALGARKIKKEDNMPLSDNLIKKIEQARKEKERGELLTIDPKNVWESI